MKSWWGRNKRRQVFDQSGLAIVKTTTSPPPPPPPPPPPRHDFCINVSLLALRSDPRLLPLFDRAPVATHTLVGSLPSSQHTHLLVLSPRRYKHTLVFSLVTTRRCWFLSPGSRIRNVDPMCATSPPSAKVHILLPSPYRAEQHGDKHGPFKNRAVY